LQKEIVGRVANGPIKFKMQAQIAGEGDDPKNPSVPWPDNRRVAPLGTITIDKLASNTVAEDKALAFIPNNLPAGIAPADPMIDFRSKAYPISVAERQ
jgi:catalase